MSENDHGHSTRGRRICDDRTKSNQGHRDPSDSLTQPRSYNQGHSPASGSLLGGRTPVDRDPSSKHHRSHDSNNRQRSSSMVRPREIPEDRELEELEKALEKEEREIQDLMDKQRRLDREIRRAKDTLDRFPYDLDKQLEKTTRQLTVAERFLSSADTVSEAEIIRMLEIINDEILQLSSVVADMIQITAQRHFAPDDDIAHFKPLALEALGNDFLDMVLHHQLQDTTAIQIGWQGVLVHRCLHLVKKWTIGTYTCSDASLHDTYERIHKTNDQTVAARWRAITFGALSTISPPETGPWIAETIKYLLSLPIMCGFISDNQKYSNFHNAFSQRITPLVDKCLELSRVLFEGVLSSDIRPYACDTGAPYDPDMADLDYEDDDERKRDSQALGERKKGEVVAFSLALGLYRSKINSDSGADESIVTKAKVILLNTAESMIS